MKKIIFLFIALFVISCGDDNNPVSSTDSNKAVWEVTVTDDDSITSDYIYFFNEDKRLSSEEKNFHFPFGEGIAMDYVRTTGMPLSNPEAFAPSLGSLMFVTTKGVRQRTNLYDDKGYFVKEIGLHNGDTLITNYSHENGILKSIKFTCNHDTRTYTFKYDKNRIIGIEEYPKLAFEYDNSGYMTKFTNDNYYISFIYKDNHKSVEVISSDNPDNIDTFQLNSDNHIEKADFWGLLITKTYQNGRLIKSESVIKKSNTKTITTFNYRKIG